MSTPFVEINCPATGDQNSRGRRPRACSKAHLASDTRLALLYSKSVTSMRPTALLLLLLNCPAVAQQTKFGCSESYGQWHVPGENASLARAADIRFRPLSDPQEILRIRKLPSKSLAGFAGQYGVRQIIFFAEPRAPGDSYQPGKVRFYAEAQRWAGARVDYALSFAGTPHGDEVDVTSGSTDYDPDSKAEREVPGWGVFPGTPDRNIPLVVLETYAGYMGANSGVNTTTRRLIDFRDGQPRSVAQLNCNEGIRGGACTAYDEEFEPQGALECDWMAARADFQCLENRTSIWNWGSVTWKQRFYLISGDMLWPPEIRPGTPASPYDWAMALERDGSDPKGRRMVLPYAGETVVLDRVVEPEVFEGAVLLMASRGDTGHLWPRFHLVFAHPVIRYVSQFAELEILTLEANDTRRGEIEKLHGPYDGAEASQRIRPAAPGILAGDPMDFVVKPLPGTAPGVHFFQVLLKQNKHHSLFWVGIDVRHRPYRGQALLIATDALEYDHCRWAHIPDSAARAEWVGSGESLARLDIEPRRYLDFEGQGYFPNELDQEAGKARCPYSMDLRWTYEKGWVMTPKLAGCDENKVTIRAIAISDQGDISARPAPILRPDQ